MFNKMIKKIINAAVKDENFNSKTSLIKKISHSQITFDLISHER